MAEEQNKRNIPNLKARRNKDELVKLCEDWGIKLEGKPPYRNLTKTDIRLAAEKYFGVVEGGGRRWKGRVPEGRTLVSKHGFGGVNRG